MGVSSRELNAFTNTLQNFGSRFNSLKSNLREMSSHQFQLSGKKQFEDRLSDASVYIDEIRSKFLTMIIDTIMLFELYRQIDAEDKEIILRNFSSQLPVHIRQNLFDLKLTLTKFHIVLNAARELVEREDGYLASAATEAERRREWDAQRWYLQQRQKLPTIKEALSYASVTSRGIFALIKFLERLMEESGKAEELIYVNKSQAEQLYSTISVHVEQIIGRCKDVLAS